VDLPGLIVVANEEHMEADVQAVHDIVDSYVQETRTIILAIVQAIRKSKRFDNDVERTIGIITKADLLDPVRDNSNCESRDP
jgi:hypothetical protein